MSLCCLKSNKPLQFTVHQISIFSHELNLHCSHFPKSWYSEHTILSKTAAKHDIFFYHIGNSVMQEALWRISDLYQPSLKQQTLDDTHQPIAKRKVFFEKTGIDFQSEIGRARFRRAAQKQQVFYLLKRLLFLKATSRLLLFVLVLDPGVGLITFHKSRTQQLLLETRRHKYALCF